MQLKHFSPDSETGLRGYLRIMFRLHQIGKELMMLNQNIETGAQATELDDGALDAVAGGYTREEWVMILKAMNELEKEKRGE